MGNVKNNIFWLMMVHCSNYIFPLITLPYLVRVLGADNFGLLAIIQAISQYFILVTDFGFNFSSTREISIHRENKEKVTLIFYSTMLAKILLFLLIICLVFFASFFIVLIRENLFLIVISLFGVIGSIIFPIWLFQGLEKMAIVSVFTSVSKVIVLLCTFFFVNSTHDLDVAVFINSLSLIVPGVLSLFLIFHKKMVLLAKPSLDQAFSQIKTAFPLFLSAISTSFYTTINTILIGLYCPASMVGHYAAADKMRIAAQGLYNPVRQAVFPRAVAMSKSEDMWGTLVVKKFGIPFIGLSLFMTIFLSVSAPIFVKYYLGKSFEEAGNYLLLMSPILILVAIATVFGHWIVIAGGHSKVLSKIYICGSLLHLIYVIPVVRNFGAIGMVVSATLTEFIVTLLIVGYVYIARNSFGYGYKN